MARQPELTKREEKKTANKLGSLSKNVDGYHDRLEKMNKKHLELEKDIQKTAKRKSLKPKHQKMLEDDQRRYLMQEDAMKEGGEKLHKLAQQKHHMEKQLGHHTSGSRGKSKGFIRLMIILVVLWLGYLLLSNVFGSFNLGGSAIEDGTCSLNEVAWLQQQAEPGEEIGIIIFHEGCEGRTADIEIWTFDPSNPDEIGSIQGFIEAVVLEDGIGETAWFARLPDQGPSPTDDGIYFRLTVSVPGIIQILQSPDSSDELLFASFSPGRPPTEMDQGNSGLLDDCPSSLGPLYREEETENDCDGIDNDCDGEVDELCGPFTEDPQDLGAGDDDDDGWYTDGDSGNSSGEGFSSYLLYAAIVILIGGGFVSLLIFERRHHKHAIPPIASLENPELQKESDEVRLREYLTLVRPMGFTPEEIRQELINNGWDPRIISRELPLNKAHHPTGITVKVIPRSYHKKVKEVFDEDEGRYHMTREGLLTPAQTFDHLKAFSDS